MLLSSPGTLQKGSTKTYKYTYDNVTSDSHETVMEQRVRSIYLTLLEQSVVPALSKFFEEHFH